MGFSKLWADVCGQPLLVQAIARARAAAPSQIVLVVGPDRMDAATNLAPDARVVPGGARRRDSVDAALSASTSEWLAIHHAPPALPPPQPFHRALPPPPPPPPPPPATP